MKNLKIIVTTLLIAFMVSCGESSDITDDNDTEELVLNEELKEGIQFDPFDIKVPDTSEFAISTPGFQLLNIQTLIATRGSQLLFDENATVETISISDDTLYSTSVVENDCGSSTDMYTQRYQWQYYNLFYTVEIGQSSDYNFWVSEYKGTEDNETARILVFGREERGDAVSGCMFIDSNGEGNIKLEWYVSEESATEGDTILTQIVYTEEEKIVTAMNIKPDGSGTSRVTQIVIETDASETVVEDVTYSWTVEGVVTTS